MEEALKNHFSKYSTPTTSFKGEIKQTGNGAYSGGGGELIPESVKRYSGKGGSAYSGNGGSAYSGNGGSAYSGNGGSAYSGGGGSTQAAASCKKYLDESSSKISSLKEKMKKLKLKQK